VRERGEPIAGSRILEDEESGARET
jgi:hypothetical protein